MMETRKISDIKIGVRHRKDMGDIAGLAATIAEIGLLHPVVINKSDELIAGERRIRAYEHLGRDEIPVTVVDLAVLLVLGEFAENEQHKPFTVSEHVAIGKEVEKALGNRQGQRTDLSQPVGKVEHTDEAAAKKAGFGNPETYRQAKVVVDAAEAEPEKFGALAEQMDATGKVKPAHKQLKELKRSPADIEKANRAGKGKPRKHELPPRKKNLWIGPRRSLTRRRRQRFRER